MIERRSADAVVKCLLVDDREENLLALRALLRAGDVELLEARSGAEALELLLGHDVALAILDVQMPTMDGFELAELMRGSERTRQIPLIFVTAGVHDRQRLFRGYDAGAVDFLHKPVDPHVLRSKAEVFFELYRQRRQLARELAERTEALRLLEMFTAVLGHDLRNPLDAIVTSAEVLRRSEDERTRVLAGRIASGGDRMRRMIEAVVDLARGRLAGGIPLAPEPADLGKLVERVVTEHRAVHPARRIALSRRGDLAGSWDPVRLAQVASNLIGNSLQHGDRDADVQVAIDGTDPERVVLSVINGGTLPRELVPQLFEPFRSGGQGERRREGLGLGLYIVQQIVDAHRGSIEVDAGQTGRIRFDVSVPRHPAG